ARADLVNQGGETTSIPRIIHRIWLDDILPGVFRSWGFEWSRLNPGWSLWDWGDSGELVNLDLPRQDLRDRAREILPNDWKRFKADVLRLELLYEFGGLYVDMDVEPHAPIDELLDGKQVLVARSRNQD